MNAIQYTLFLEAEKLRKVPGYQYEGYEIILRAADQMFAAPAAPARRIPLTSHERRQQENERRRQQEKRAAAALDLQKAAAKLREAGYRVSPPKPDDDLDAAAETWLQGKHG